MKKFKISEFITQGNTKAKICLLSLMIILLVIIICGSAILYTKWNVIMGYKSCESGDYETALKYYTQELKKGRADETIKTRKEALHAYIWAEKSYENDNMGKMSEYLDVLKNTESIYPARGEINVIQKKYDERMSEINSYDKAISEIEALFSDATQMDVIKNKCDEMSKNNVTKTQKNKLGEMKDLATEYISIKSSYDQANYEDVVSKVSGLIVPYSSYAIKDSIETMKNEAQKILDERELIKTSLKAARDKFNEGNFESSLFSANELLGMNLTAEERQEVETIKATSEKKIEEEKAAAEQEEKQARQNMIDSAIKISATSLYEAFTTNKVGAETKYKDKILLVTGTVYKIDEVWIFGDPYISLKAGYVADGVTAYFSSDTADQLTDIKQGQTVQILGKCGGRSMGLVTLHDCNIVG